MGEGNLLGIMQGTKFDHTDKWYMQTSETILKNKTLKIF